MKQLFVLILGWVIVINIFTLLANNRFNLKPDTSYPWINPQYTYSVPGWNINKLHNRWDSFWYLDIAQNGYNYINKDQLSNLVFFPLYPMLVKAVGAFLNNDYLAGGWLVSLTFIALSAVFLYKIVKEFHPESDPLLSVFLLLIFPTAVFFNSIYTESTFLFLSVASFYFMLRKNFLWAAIFGFFASLTRLSGALLFLPLFVEGWKEKKWWYAFLVPMGAGVFFLYHYLKFGDFLLFFKVENLWGRNFHLDLANFIFNTNPGIVNTVLDIFFTLVGVIATVFAFKKRLSYGVYMATSLLIALSSGSLMSVGRYVLVLFPIYILGASLKSKIYQYLWIMVSTMFFAMYTLQFVSHYWAG